MGRSTAKFGRRWHVVLRRHGVFASVFAIGLLAAVAFDAVAWYQRLQWNDAVYSGVLETQVVVVLFLQAAAWAVLGVDQLLCHGVSRRTITWEQSAANIVLALCAAVVVYVPWAVTHVMRTPLRLTIGSRRFLYSYSMVTVRSRTPGVASQGISGEAIATGGPVPDGLPDEFVPRTLPLGMVFVFLGVLALMLAVAMAGQLVGVLLAAARSKGAGWFMAAVFAFVVIVGGWREIRLSWAALDWLWNAIKGGVTLTVGDGMVVADKPVVWIPLVLAVAFAALAIWFTFVVTRRREVITSVRGAVL